MIGKCTLCSHMRPTGEYGMLYCGSKDKVFNITFCSTYHECFEPKEASDDVL